MRVSVARHRPLWQISVTASAEAEDALAELLTEIFGVAASSWCDAATGRSTISAFLETQPVRNARAELTQRIRQCANCGLRLGTTQIRFSRLRPQDWAESWKRHFPPIEIRNALLIRPSWSRKKPRNGQREIVLDPGLSFGTGHHPTTEFCLEQIAAGCQKHVPQSLLDIGTGSGILSIAAARLGYKPVDAFDYDPEAVRAAQQNARANSVEKAIRVWRQDLKRLPPRPVRHYSLICANLISTLLIEERQRIITRLTPGGVLVVAGILHTEFVAVRRVYEALGLILVKTRRTGEWRSGAFKAMAGTPAQVLRHR